MKLTCQFRRFLSSTLRPVGPSAHTLSSTFKGFSTEKQLRKILIGGVVLLAYILIHAQTTIPKNTLRQHSSAGSSGWCRQESPSVVVGFHRAAGVWQTA